MGPTSQTKILDSVTFFKKGTVIFAEGLQNKNLYLIKSGEVRLVKLKNNRLVSLGILKEKEILNEIPILTNSANSYSAIASTDVELVLVSSKDVRTVIESGPKWVNEIFQTLCDRLNSVQEVIEEHQVKDMLDDKNLALSKEQELEYTAILRSYRADK